VFRPRSPSGRPTGIGTTSTSYAGNGKFAGHRDPGPVEPTPLGDLDSPLIHRHRSHIFSPDLFPPVEQCGFILDFLWKVQEP
jgi:hypothetical protein